MSEISSRVRNLADAIGFQFADESKPVATGDNTAYLTQLPEALKEHEGFATFEKKLPGILAKDISAEEKAEAVKEVLYGNTDETIKAIHKYDAEFFAAVSLGLGEAGRKYASEHKDVVRITGSVGTVGRNKFTAVYDDKYTKNIPQGKGEPVQQEDAYGRVVVAHDVYGNRKSAEQMIAVRNHLEATARKSLAD